jgi:hypothetical protein
VKQLLTVIPALLLMGCSAGVKRKPKPHIVLVPPYCAVITRFDKPCPPGLGDHVCNGVHLKIKPDPDCNEYNRQQVLQVGKPQ